MYGHSSGAASRTTSCQNSRLKTDNCEHVAQPFAGGRAAASCAAAPRRSSWSPGVVAADDPRQVGVDAEQHGDAIEIEDERQRDGDDGVQTEERREAEEDAERVGAAPSVPACRARAAARRASAAIRALGQLRSSEVPEPGSAGAPVRRRRLPRSSSRRSACRRQCGSAGHAASAVSAACRRPRCARADGEQQFVVVAAAQIAASRGVTGRGIEPARWPGSIGSVIGVDA